MGKIKKILENELVGGVQTTDVYPVTSIKAVYDENNERLDHILNRRGVVNVSTNYNDDHIAEVLTLEEAINIVPSDDRIVGFLGSILTDSGWKLYQFKGESIANWKDVSLWSEISHRDEVIKAIIYLTGNLFSNVGRITIEGSVATSQLALHYTDYIDLEGLSTVTVLGFSSENTSVISFYDSEKSFISSVSGNSNNDKIITVDVPSTAKYCRCTGKEGSSFCIGTNLDLLSEKVKYNTLKYINVSELYGDTHEDGSEYYTLKTARERVPVKDRIKGQIISFLSGHQTWELWMWHGMSEGNNNPTGWHNDNLWKKIDFDVNDDIQEINYWILGDYSDTPLKDGYVISYLSGIEAKNANTATSGYLVCAKSSYIRLVMTVGNSNTSQAGIAFYDNKKNFISGTLRPYKKDESQGSMLVDVPVPEDAIYFRTTYWNSTIAVAQLPFSCHLVTIVPSKEDIDNIKEDIDNIKGKEIDYSNSKISEDKLVPSYTSGELEAATYLGHTNYIPCTEDDSIEISMPCGSNPASVAGIAFYDSDKNFISGVQRPTTPDIARVINTYTAPKDASYFRSAYFNAKYRETYGEFYCKIYPYVDDPFVLQTIGNNKNKVMSQKAVTDLLTGNALNTEYLTQDEICDFYAINSDTGEVSSAITAGCTRYIDCEANQEFILPLIGFDSDNLGYAFYDENKNYLSGGSQKGTDFQSIKVTAPNNARYIRFSGRTYKWLKENNHSDNLLNTTVTYTSLLKSDKRPYQSGYIYFSARVNQKVNNYWDSSVSDDSMEDYEYTTGVLALPESYTPAGKPTPLIMYCHGYSHGVWYDHWGNTDNFRAQKDYWVSKGYAVFDCNGARNNSMTVNFTGAGSNQFVEGYRKCFEYIHEHYNVEDNIYVVGGSAGCPTAIQYCYTWNNVKALAILSGWTDLYTCSWGQNVRDTFVEYLGFEDTETYEKDKTIGYDPALRILSIGEDEVIPYFPTSVKAWIGSLESSHVLYTALYRFVNALREGGCLAYICEKEGLSHAQVVSGHTLSIDNDVIDWFSSH